MEQRKLKDVVTFLIGLNQIRGEKQFPEETLHFYDQASFMEDYQHESIENQGQDTDKDVRLHAGDVVISNPLQRATLVGTNNAGKILSTNFTKVHFLDAELDKGYFLYLFNSYPEVQREKVKGAQGTTTVAKLTVKALEEIIIPYLPLAQQQKIGAVYLETLKLQNNLAKYGELLQQFSERIMAAAVKEED